MAIFGSALIILCAVFSSYLYEKKQKRKLTFLKELISFINHIKTNIEFFGMPVSDIFASYITEDEEIIAIKNGDLSKIKSLDTDLMTEIRNFFLSLGKGFKNEELKLCEITLISLYEKEKNALIEYPNKIKIFRSISLFVGASIIILLV